MSPPKGSGSLVSFQSRGLTEVVRASLHYYNIEAEIDDSTDTLETVPGLGYGLAPSPFS